MKEKGKKEGKGSMESRKETKERKKLGKKRKFLPLVSTLMNFDLSTKNKPS